MDAKYLCKGFAAVTSTPNDIILNDIIPNLLNIFIMNIGLTELVANYSVQPLSETTMCIKQLYCEQW